MKFTKIIQTEKGTIYILDAHEIGLRRSSFNSKKEYQSYCIHKMIKASLGSYKVYHDNDGAPYLKELKSIEISISHSDNYFALYCSSKGAIGVDIQLRTKDLRSHADYFLNNTELHQDWSNDQLYIIWGVKEVLYKMLKGKVSNIYDKTTIYEIKNLILD